MAWYFFLQTEKIASDLQIECVFWDHFGWPWEFSPKVSPVRKLLLTGSAYFVAQCPYRTRKYQLGNIS